MTFSLPGWLRRRVDSSSGMPTGHDAQARMRIAVALAVRNVADGGGPFGALVADENNRLLGMGVNLVLQRKCSVLHAEIVALIMAQDFVGEYDLSKAAACPVLVSSVEPCAMCFGALVWAGIKRIECGATTADAEAIGFDEGPKPVDWIDQLSERGVQTETGILRHEAAAVLENYRKSNGIIY